MIAVAVLSLTLSCSGEEIPIGFDRGGRVTEATCDSLVASSFFDGTATLQDEDRDGETVTCELDVEANSPALRRLGVDASNCEQPNAPVTIIAKLSRSTLDWRHDPMATAGAENSDCTVA